MSDGVMCIKSVCNVCCHNVWSVCVPSAAVTGVFSSALPRITWCCMEHWTRISKLQNDIYSIVLVPQVIVKIQRISQNLLMIFILSI